MKQFSQKDFDRAFAAASVRHGLYDFQQRGRMSRDYFKETLANLIAAARASKIGEPYLIQELSSQADEAQRRWVERVKQKAKPIAGMPIDEATLKFKRY